MSAACEPDPVLAAVEVLSAFVVEIAPEGRSKRLDETRRNAIRLLNEIGLVRAGQLPAGAIGRNGLRAVR